MFQSTEQILSVCTYSFINICSNPEIQQDQQDSVPKVFKNFE